MLSAEIEAPEFADSFLCFGRFIGSQTLSMLYGYTVDSEDDAYLRAMNQTLHLLSNHIASLGAGLWLVDVFPACERAAHQLTYQFH